MLDQKKNQGKPQVYLGNVAVRWGSFNIDYNQKMLFEDSEIERFQIRKGDIVLCEGGEPGRCAIWTNAEPIYFQKALHRIRVKEPNDNWYLYYYLSHYVKTGQADSLFTGTTIKHLPRQVLLELPIYLPNPPQQKKISSILKSLDDKIENNRKINENLEQQAQALFKSWFVDFEPFHDQPFVESELGMIPKILAIKRISELPHILETGRRPKGGVGELNQGIPSVGAEHVKGLGNYDFSKTKYITKEYATSLKTGKINGYELLIYKDGGKPGYFIPNYSIFGEGYPFDECYLNEHVFKLDFNNKGFNAFCYFYFQSDHIMHYLNSQGSKAAIPGINRQDIESISIYSPENEIVNKYCDWVLPLIKTILTNSIESRRLSQLRDTLLPKLMSGEIKL